MGLELLHLYRNRLFLATNERLRVFDCCPGSLMTENVLLGRFDCKSKIFASCLLAHQQQSLSQQPTRFYSFSQLLDILTIKSLLNKNYIKILI